jgi:hypothetical protein
MTWSTIIAKTTAATRSGLPRLQPGQRTPFVAVAAGHVTPENSVGWGVTGGSSSG